MKTHQLIIGQDVTGKDIEVTVYTFPGTEPEKHYSVYIQASMHGAELQGNLVIHKLLEEFKKNPPKGKITLVPHCNPIGGNCKMGEYTYGRFDPISGDNWNRVYFNAIPYVEDFAKASLELSNEEIVASFKTYIARLITENLEEPWKVKRGEMMGRRLQQLSCHADLVLDLHTDSFSSRYTYAPKYAKEAAQATGLPNVLLIENEFGGAMDEATFCPWWTLSEKLKELGKTDFVNPVEGLTFELGSQERVIDIQAQEDFNCILRYLKHKDVINSNVEAKQTPDENCHHYDDFIVHYTPIGGLYEMLIQPGEKFTKDQPIAICTQLNNKEGKTQHTIYAPFNGILVASAESSALPQGTKLANLFRTN